MLRHARDQEEREVIASFWLGLASICAAIIGIVLSVSGLYGIAVVLAFGAIITAHFARQRAQEKGDAEIVRLSRVGQIAGWLVIGFIVVALVVVVLLLIIVFGTHVSPH
jgi:hypothetical protein